MLPDGGFSVMYGQPGSGKTFIALELAMSVAMGRPFAGRQTRQGPVVYVAAEGLSGLPNRLNAWCRHAGIERQGIDSFYCISDPISLPGTGHGFPINELIAVLEDKAPALIQFDTLSMCMAGADENQTQDMQRVVSAVKGIQRALPGTSVMLIHHTGKGGGKERGNSALRGAADTMIKVTSTKESKYIWMACDKQKDEELFKDYRWEKHKVAESLVLINGREFVKKESEEASEPSNRKAKTTKPDRRAPDSREIILSALRQQQDGLKVGDIQTACEAQGLTIGPKQYYKILGDLEKLGRVERQGAKPNTSWRATDHHP